MDDATSKDSAVIDDDLVEALGFEPAASDEIVVVDDVDDVEVDGEEFDADVMESVDGDSHGSLFLPVDDSAGDVSGAPLVLPVDDEAVSPDTTEGDVDAVAEVDVPTEIAGDDFDAVAEVDVPSEIAGDDELGVDAEQLTVAPGMDLAADVDRAPRLDDVAEEAAVAEGVEVASGPSDGIETSDPHELDVGLPPPPVAADAIEAVPDAPYGVEADEIGTDDADLGADAAVPPPPTAADAVSPEGDVSGPEGDVSGPEGDVSGPEGNGAGLVGAAALVAAAPTIDLTHVEAPLESLQSEPPTEPPTTTVAAPAARARPRRRKRVRARKARRVVRHVDPWSVLTFSVIFHLCLFAALLLSSVLVWNAAVAAGTIDNIESFIIELGDYETFEINGDVVFRAAVIIAGMLTLASSVMVVLLTVVFNLISDLVGGIRVTVIEEETVRVPVDPNARATGQQPTVGRTTG